jgi:hypothetical protein
MNENMFDEVEDIYKEGLNIYWNLERDQEGKYIEDIYWILRR